MEEEDEEWKRIEKGKGGRKKKAEIAKQKGYSRSFAGKLKKELP